MSFSTLQAVKNAFSELGCKEIIVKLLAKNQDNEKNQIYFGYSNELLSIFPSQVRFRTSSESTAKIGSKAGKPILEHSFKFFWISEGHQPSLAPNAKIIDYFQYPEMRFSGFLSGCMNPPDALRRDSQDSYGRRVLLLGVTEECVFGCVVSDIDCNFIDELSLLPKWLDSKIFLQLKIDNKKVQTINPELLLSELHQIGSKSQYESQILRRTGSLPEPFKGSQGAGWTMEALLGIPRNSSGLPDKYGFEIKTFMSSTITLMTPEPDFGYRYEKGLTAFLRKFGWPGTKNDGSQRFNGKHSTLSTYKKSGLTLVIENWNMENNNPTGLGDPNVLLVNPLTEEIAAGWSFNKLAEKWGKKHAGAIYIPATKYKFSEGSFATHYSYGPDVYCGQGTSAILLLKAIGLGAVYLDPGDRVNQFGEEKKRTQWRISKARGKSFSSTLAPLYDQMKTYQI